MYLNELLKIYALHFRSRERNKKCLSPEIKIQSMFNALQTDNTIIVSKVQPLLFHAVLLLTINLLLISQ